MAGKSFPTLPAIIVALALTLPACAAAHDALAGSEWRVTAINGHATPAEGNYVMRFRDNQVGGQFGCNHFGGPYQMKQDVMTTGAMAMTEMACIGPADQFEHWGLTILTQPMQVEWRGERAMRLSNAAGSIDLSR